MRRQENASIQMESSVFYMFAHAASVSDQRSRRRARAVIKSKYNEWGLIRAGG